MENPAYTCVLWSTERSGEQKVTEMREIDTPKTILAQLTALAKSAEELNCMHNYQREQNNPYSNTYILGWKNHIHLSRNND